MIVKEIIIPNDVVQAIKFARGIQMESFSIRIGSDVYMYNNDSLLKNERLSVHRGRSYASFTVPEELV